MLAANLLGMNPIKAVTMVEKAVERLEFIFTGERTQHPPRSTAFSGIKPFKQLNNQPFFDKTKVKSRFG